MRGGSIAARGETGPVVEVDDADIAVGRYDAVAAINLHIEHVRRVLAYLAHLVLVKFQALALAIDGFVAILAMTLVKWIEPIEEPRTRHTVKLDKVGYVIEWLKSPVGMIFAATFIVLLILIIVIEDKWKEKADPADSESK